MQKHIQQIKLPNNTFTRSITKSYDKARNLDMIVSLNPCGEITGSEVMCITVQERRHLPRSYYESVAAMSRSVDRVIRGEPTPEPFPLWTTSPRRF